MEISEIETKYENNNKSIKPVGEMVEKFSERGINYFVIGSFARNVYIDRELQSPEIDLLVPNL